MTDLRISLVQTYIHWEDKASNFRLFEKHLAGLAGQTDLILLPEMFTTGFTMAASRLAEPLPGPTLHWMQRMARSTDAVLAGSYIAKDDGGYFNRLLWMRPDGSWAHYDKRHLFTLAGEHEHFQAGERQLLVELKGWQIMPLICYDLRFPVWSRNTMHYDLLLYVANFPARRRLAWKSLLQARAIENQAYTIGLNRVGRDGNDIYYAGDSMCFDAVGEVLCHLAHTEQVVTLTLDAAHQGALRERFQFLPDRENFQMAGLKNA